jgi:hypothetical protein
LVEELVIHPFAPAWLASSVESYVRRALGDRVQLTCSRATLRA